MKEEKEVAGGITHLSEMHFKICICVNKMKQYSSFLRFYHFDLRGVQEKCSFLPKPLQPIPPLLHIAARRDLQSF